jgi:hypothetical protein
LNEGWKTLTNEVAALYAKTRRRDFERLLSFLSQLHDGIRQVFDNGQRLALRPQPYSARRLARRGVQHRLTDTAQERVVSDTKAMLQLLTAAVKKAALPRSRARR